MNGDMLRAGAAEVDITPALGIQIGGDIGKRRPVEAIHERLYARALALDSKGRRFCFLSIDLLEITEPYDAEIRRRAAAFGFTPDAVMVHPLQNHAAPALGNEFWSEEYQDRVFPSDLWWLGGVDRRYVEPALEGITLVMQRATERMVPVAVRHARTMDARVAFNRRFILRDGTAVCHPGAQTRPRILQAEGPVDPEVGVMVFQTADGSAIAALLQHTCHPCHGGSHNAIMAGWPGAWVDAMRGTFGSACVPMVVNGCCGNIHHCNHLDPTQDQNHRRMGAFLADSACLALQSLGEPQQVPLDWRMAQIKLPPRAISSDELAQARALIAQPIPFTNADKTATDWNWCYAHSICDLAERLARQPYFEYPVQAVRIGECALVALGGEPFVEVQLRLKRESPVNALFVAHMANGGIGYIPTPDALRRGGYETRTANWSKYAPEALDLIGDKAASLLADLFC